MAVLIEVACVTPLTCFPASVVAWYRNLPMESSDRVDVPQHFGDRRDVVRNHLDPGVSERPHPLGHRQFLDLVMAGLTRDQLPHRLREGAQLVDPHPVPAPRVETEVAPLATQELILRGATEPQIELDLFVAWSIRHRA